MFFQQVVNGLTIGSMYALVAIGYTMVFGVLKLVNFSHGSVFMVGAYLTLELSLALGGNFFLAAALSLVLAGVLGVVIDRAALQRLRVKKADRITALISTLGVGTILDNAVMIGFGSETKAFPNVLQLGRFTVGGAVVSWVQVIILLLALVLMAIMSAIVYRTRMGCAMRATSQNADAARLMGISVNRVIAFTFFIGSLLASVAGTMYGMYYEAIDPMMGSVISMKTFACVVLGGVGVLPGAMLGGLLIGVAEAVGASYISSGYRDAIAFAILILVLLAAAAVFPLLVSNPYAIRLAILSGIFIILSLSLNLLTGFSGQISLGHIAFYGIGAYTAAILSKNFGVNFLICMFAAVVVTALFGLLLGLPALKLGGYYLAIVTLGFSEIVRLVEINWMDLTNGPLGINGIPKPALFGVKLSSPRAYYYMCLLLVALTILVIRNILESRVGYALGAIRGDENAAKFMGVNIFRYKIMAFMVSAGIAGLAGAFFAQYVTFIDPTSFASDQSTLVLIMVIFGGIGSLPGSVIGAGKTTFFNVITGVNTPDEGSVHFLGEEITGTPAHEIVAKGIARTFQNIRLFKNMTAQENVIAGMHTASEANLLDAVFRTRRHREETRACEQRADELLSLVGLYDFRYELAARLPYGHQRRLEIARALAGGPKLLLLDEPAAGMNEQETAGLLEFIRKLRGMGCTILLIEHDMKLVMGICENIYVLDHGELIAQGPPEEIQNNPRVIEAYLGKEG